MFGCMEPGTKVTAVGRVGNPGSQAHGYSTPAEMLMALQNRSILILGSTTIQDSVMDAFFRTSIIITVDDGTPMLFWLDLWLDGKDISEFAPDLVQEVSRRCHGRRTVDSTFLNNTWIKDLTGPCTLSVLVQYLLLRQRVENIVLNTNTQNCFIRRWCPLGTYLASSTYKAMFYGQTVVSRAKELWGPRFWTSAKFSFG
jgi:hypothetical protein